MLEKWYVWDGYINPKATWLLLSNGWIIRKNDVPTPKLLWSDFDENIVAYTIGEKVESKRGSVNVR